MSIEIKVDDDFLDLAHMYLDAKKKDIDLYKEALKFQDYKIIKDLSHKMKGTGASYGFDYLTEVGAEIENLSLKNEGEKIASLIQDFENYLNNVVISVK